MREAYGNLWEVEAELRVITTNGTVTKQGKAVMGRGCAKEAKEMFPGIDRKLGELLNQHGNRPMRLRRDLATFPVKHNWWEKADPELIRTSAKLLADLVQRFGFRYVVIPRPGCGNGGLTWGQVKPRIEFILDDRFTVITFSEVAE